MTTLQEYKAHLVATLVDPDATRISILNKVSDLISDLLYYDRKNDEDLRLGDIELAIAKRNITIQDMVDEFAKQLHERLQEPKDGNN